MSGAGVPARLLPATTLILLEPVIRHWAFRHSSFRRCVSAHWALCSSSQHWAAEESNPASSAPRSFRRRGYGPVWGAPPMSMCAQPVRTRALHNRIHCGRRDSNPHTPESRPGGFASFAHGRATDQGGTRTHNPCVLSARPLPVGLLGRCLSSSIHGIWSGRPVPQRMERRHSK